MNERYAVMTADLKAMSFWDDRLDVCKKYCRPGSVVVERVQKCCGFSVTVQSWRVFFRKEYRPRVVRVVWPKETP